MQQIQISSAWFSYPDAQLMQQAALNVFHRLFAEAGPAATVFAGRDTYAMPLAAFSGTGKTSQPN
jgi:NAD(P)H-hydrate repair Nnr-like enzyme with NAD(P)H-hydrate epimerase domain